MYSGLIKASVSLHFSSSLIMQCCSFPADKRRRVMRILRKILQNCLNKCCQKLQQKSFILSRLNFLIFMKRFHSSMFSSFFSLDYHRCSIASQQQTTSLFKQLNKLHADRFFLSSFPTIFEHRSVDAHEGEFSFRASRVPWW